MVCWGVMILNISSSSQIAFGLTLARLKYEGLGMVLFMTKILPLFQSYINNALHHLIQSLTEVSKKCQEYTTMVIDKGAGYAFLLFQGQRGRNWANYPLKKMNY